MMIKGIGIDIIEMTRIRKSIENTRFIERILTEKEREKYYQIQNETRKVEYVAGRFAAKEAFAKAMGTGIGRLSFQDMEVLNDEKGKPFIRTTLPEEWNIFISITHSKEYAVVQVVLEEN